MPIGMIEFRAFTFSICNYKSKRRYKYRLEENKPSKWLIINHLEGLFSVFDFYFALKTRNILGCFIRGEK
ncbi:MAG: hypothetical protein RLZZ628_4182 [Bacteroidota bacterium]|jgi:hypothetical protein